MIESTWEDTLKEVSILKSRKEHILKQLNTFRFVWWGWLLSSFLGIGLSYIYYGSFHHDLFGKMLFGAFFGSFFYAYICGAFRFMLSNRLQRLEVELIKVGATELQENIDQNFFTKLVQINFKYLDQYYLQTQEQASKSFILSAFAAISGLVIIATGV